MCPEPVIRIADAAAIRHNKMTALTNFDNCRTANLPLDAGICAQNCCNEGAAVIKAEQEYRMWYGQQMLTTAVINNEAPDREMFG